MSNSILQRYPALGFPRYRRYWLASFASVGATQLITLGQGWLIFELSGSALTLGFLGAAAALPNIMMTLIGGVVADRFDKRRIMMFTSLAITALLLLLAGLDYTGLVAVWHVLAVAGCISLINGLDWPVRVSIYTSLIDRSAFLSAVALNSFIWQATRMAIPAFGGLIIALWDTAAVFAIGAAGFFAMFVVMATLEVAPTATTEHSPWQQLTEGMRFILHSELFKWLLALTFVGMFFSASYIQVMPIFADLMNVGETGYGYLLSAGGIGSVLGTLLVGGINKYRRLGTLMLGSAVATAIAVIAFAMTADAGLFVAGLSITLIASLMSSVFMITSMTVLQLAVPDALRGRVMGIHTIGYSLMSLGGLFIGALAEVLDAGMAVLLGNLIYLSFIILIWFRRPNIRRLDGQALETRVE
ncbi:MAG: MFS transporter [Proteobacteria bacterium]|nr:MFS transporter [Pseudomonadota bacterium]